MDDQPNRCRHSFVPHQTIGRLVPVFRFCELLRIDDNEDVVVGAVTLHRMRFIDPRSAGVGTEQDNLQDPAAFLEVGRATLERIGKLLVDDLHNAGKLALFLLGKMFEARFHIQPIG
ncbi:hypothetical protein D9M70_541830 [compost metagenome]